MISKPCLIVYWRVLIFVLTNVLAVLQFGIDSWASYMSISHGTKHYVLLVFVKKATNSCKYILFLLLLLIGISICFNRMETTIIPLPIPTLGPQEA
jgi:hypothetical protein